MAASHSATPARSGTQPVTAQLADSKLTEAEEADEEEATADESFLFIPEEPVKLKEQILSKALLDPDKWSADLQKKGHIAVWLWDQWGIELAEAKIDKAAFIEITVGYRREIWLWVMGERIWDQMLTGLIGRVGRRLPGT